MPQDCLAIVTGHGHDWADFTQEIMGSGDRRVPEHAARGGAKLVVQKGEGGWIGGLKRDFNGKHMQGHRRLAAIAMAKWRTMFRHRTLLIVVVGNQLREGAALGEFKMGMVVHIAARQQRQIHHPDGKQNCNDFHNANMKSSSVKYKCCFVTQVTIAQLPADLGRQGFLQRMGFPKSQRNVSCSTSNVWWAYDSLARPQPRRSTDHPINLPSLHRPR